MLATITEHYNWQAALAIAILVTVIAIVGKFIIFQVPAFRQMRTINLEEDQKRLAQEKYRQAINAGRIVGFASMAFFFVAILPFSATLEARSLGRILLEVFVILMVYDFFYYLTHRFVLHGNGAMRLVHALHHQARNPCWIDGSYVHPLEISIGLWLFFGSVIGYALVAGPAHVATVVVCFLAFLGINQLNHTYFKLPHFPYQPIDWIVAKHHIHHENMRKGNYATITMLYDKLFGTLE